MICYICGEIFEDEVAYLRKTRSQPVNTRFFLETKNTLVVIQACKNCYDSVNEFNGAKALAELIFKNNKKNAEHYKCDDLIQPELENIEYIAAYKTDPKRVESINILHV